jgi:hypothetical protein
MSRHPEEIQRRGSKIKRLIKGTKEETFQTHFQNLTATADTDYSIWRVTKRLKQQKKCIPPIRNADHTWARSDKEKANTFAEHLEKTFKSNELLQNKNLETDINKALKEQLQITQPIKFLTPKEIQNVT